MKDLVDMVHNDGGGKGKKKKAPLNGPVPLTKDLLISIEDIITQKIKLKDLQGSLNDSTKGLADKMQVTPAKMKEMINNIIKAREDEGEHKIKEKKESIQFVDVYQELKEQQGL